MTTSVDTDLGGDLDLRAAEIADRAVIEAMQGIANQYPPDIFTPQGQTRDGIAGTAIRERMLAEIAHRQRRGVVPVVVTWRTGPRNGRTICAQLGDAPSDADPMIGSMDTAAMAQRVVDVMNGGAAPQNYINGLCARLVHFYRSLDLLANEDTEPARRSRISLISEISGMLAALCLAMGWDTAADAEKDGAADRYVCDWHNRVYADEEPW